MYLKKNVQHNLKQSFRHASFKTLTIRCAIRRLLGSYNSMLPLDAMLARHTCMLWHVSYIWGRSPLLLMSLVEELCVLPELTVWSCLQSDWHTVGSRAFPVAAAHTWNSLPEHIVSASTLQPFKRHLKTFILQQSFRLALQWTSQWFRLLRPLLKNLDWLINWWPCVCLCLFLYPSQVGVLQKWLNGSS